MEAVILVGGLGTRLRSVVSDRPKPMAEVNGKPFLSIILDSLVEGGVNHVILATGYKGEFISNYYGDSYRNIKLDYSHENKKLGTGGAVKQALGFLINKRMPFFVLNGDSFIELEFARMYSQHLFSNSQITIATKFVSSASRYGLLEINEKKITGFKEKGSSASGYINSGIYIINPDLFKSEIELAFSLEKDFIEKRIEQLDISPFESKGFFIDIGIPEDYERAKRHWLIEK